eukprot:gene43870-53642_t
MFTPPSGPRTLTNTSSQAAKSLVKAISGNQGKVNSSLREWDEQVGEMDAIVRNLSSRNQLLQSLHGTLHKSSFWSDVLWSRYPEAIRLLMGKVMVDVEEQLAQLRTMQKRLSDIYLLVAMKVTENMSYILNESFQAVQGTEDLIDQILLSHNYLKALSLEHKTRAQLVADISQCFYCTEQGSIDAIESSKPPSLESLLNQWLELDSSQFE